MTVAVTVSELAEERRCGWCAENGVQRAGVWLIGTDRQPGHGTAACDAHRAEVLDMIARHTHNPITTQGEPQ